METASCSGQEHLDVDEHAGTQPVFRVRYRALDRDITRRLIEAGINGCDLAFKLVACHPGRLTRSFLPTAICSRFSCGSAKFT